MKAEQSNNAQNTQDKLMVANFSHHMMNLISFLSSFSRYAVCLAFSPSLHCHFIRFLSFIYLFLFYFHFYFYFSPFGRRSLAKPKWIIYGASFLFPFEVCLYTIYRGLVFCVVYFQMDRRLDGWIDGWHSRDLEWAIEDNFTELRDETRKEQCRQIISNGSTANSRSAIRNNFIVVDLALLGLVEWLMWTNGT